jgi:hypothetical protein
VSPPYGEYDEKRVEERLSKKIREFIRQKEGRFKETARLQQPIRALLGEKLNF